MIIVENKLTQKTKIRKIDDFLVIFSVSFADCFLFRNCIKINTKTNIISKGLEETKNGLSVEKKDLIYLKTRIDLSDLKEKTKEKIIKVIEEDFELLKKKEKIRAKKPTPAPMK